ncbi:MAG: hypothetical protein GQE15_21320 [Archangiaceae bacterium]|nr:hypothetical protein [Archangiaceae bacterium]
MIRAFVTVVVLLACEASADCMGAWLRAAPDVQVELTPNAHVLVTLGGSHTSVSPAKLVFMSGTKRVPAELVRTFDGYQQKLVLVRATLEPGSWELIIEGMKTAQRLGPWKVVPSGDAVVPAFEQPPVAGDTKWTAYGCGPGSSLKVKQVKTNEPVFIEAAATVNGQTTVGLLVPREQELELGHGMCSGGFSFKPGARVSVVLTPVDFAGNRGAPSERLMFTAPSP